MKRVIVDTGPLVAYFDRDSEFHAWARDRFRELADPLISCQPVLTEALFVLKRGGIDPDLVLALVERGLLVCDFDVHREIGPLRPQGTRDGSRVLRNQLSSRSGPLLRFES